MINKLLYLGPVGSYSEIAKTQFTSFLSLDNEVLPVDSIYRIAQILKESKEEKIGAVIPIENSIEGVVRETQDCLISLAEAGFKIYAETKLSIEHCLISFGDKESISQITSHPQALAQCRNYITQNFSEKVELLPSLSTSQAINSLRKEAPHCAAIGSRQGAILYSVPILESAINDEPNNTTRFILLSKNTPSNVGNNKISITFSTENKAGALNKVLSILENYGLNMSYIDSRPSKKELGEYVFYVDFAGHIEFSEVMLALTEIQAHIKMFNLLSDGAICV